jgi:hypothetical protein
LFNEIHVVKRIRTKPKGDEGYLNFERLEEFKPKV